MLRAIVAVLASAVLAGCAIAPTSPAVVDCFLANKLEVAAVAPSGDTP